MGEFELSAAAERYVRPLSSTEIEYEDQKEKLHDALRRGKLVIHGKDGCVQDKDSFGAGPFQPRDKKY